MRRRFRVFLVAALSCACGRDPSSTSVPATSVDAQFRKTLDAYVVEFLRRYPTVNTYLGGGGLHSSLGQVDGTLRDYSPTALEREDRWLMDTQRELRTFELNSLSPGSRIDRDVALAQIQFMLHQHQVRRYQQRALDTYVGEPFRSLDWQLQGMTQTGDTTYGTEAEWALVISRLRAIPEFLETAEAQLQAGIAAGNTPDWRMLERDGLGSTGATAVYFGETLPKLAAERIVGGSRARLISELGRASVGAKAAYESFRAFVAATFFIDRQGHQLRPEFASDRFVMGEGEYDWALANNFRLDIKTGQLFEEAWPIVQRTQSDMVALARQIGADHRWSLPSQGLAAVRAVFDRLSIDYPRSDAEMIAWYRDSAFRLVSYGRRAGLFDIPADYRLDVTETPPPLQASIDGAAYYPAPPFKTSGVGRFYVTPTHNSADALMANNRAAIADLAAHEGFPGHDWHFKVMTQYRSDIPPVRWLTPGAVEDSSSMWEDSMAAEGWGLYAESLPAEPQPTLPNGFYTLEERLYQLQGQLYRDLRVRIDAGIHSGRLSYDEATTLYSEVVDFLPGSCTSAAPRSAQKAESCASAERAIFRYSKWPTQAITYRVGKDQIVALRDDARRLLGERFSPTRFHLAFMRQGTIPVGYFRGTLLSMLQQAK